MNSKTTRFHPLMKKVTMTNLKSLHNLHGLGMIKGVTFAIVTINNNLHYNYMYVLWDLKQVNPYFSGKLVLVLRCGQKKKCLK